MFPGVEKPEMWQSLLRRIALPTALSNRVSFGRLATHACPLKKLKDGSWPKAAVIGVSIMGVSLLAADNCFVACGSVESRDISINGVAFKALVVRACQVNLRCAEHTWIGGGVCKSLPLTHYTAAPPGWHVLSYETKPFIWHGGPRTLNVNISGDERVEFYVRDKRTVSIVVTQMALWTFLMVKVDMMSKPLSLRVSEESMSTSNQAA